MAIGTGFDEIEVFSRKKNKKDTLSRWSGHWICSPLITDLEYLQV